MKGVSKVALLVLGSVLAAQSHARLVYPAEIYGRDLIGAGWFGHTAIATRGMNNESGMQYPADAVIEILNENPVGQINSIPNFKSRSKYWGSRWGVVNIPVRGYLILNEANHQRWWCPKYTLGSDFNPGQGIPTNGTIISCGKWRCDTYVYWLFGIWGYDLVGNKAMMPRTIFYAFPYVNDERFLPDGTYHEEKRTLADVNAEQLNNMSLETIQMIIDNPPENYIEAPYVEQVRVARDKNVKDIIRGLMIDKISMQDKSPRTVEVLLDMYKGEKNLEVKFKLVQAIMMYNQSHIQKEEYQKKYLSKVSEFFNKLLNDKTLDKRLNDDALRGYIDTHSSDDIIANKELVDHKLAHLVTHEQSIMLKSSLMFKSPELQKIYTESVVSELRKVNNSDLDSYLFGPLSLAYKTHPEFLTKDSANLVSDYLIEVQFKYSAQGIVSDKEDFTRSTTAPYHAALSQALGLR